MLHVTTETKGKYVEKYSLNLTFMRYIFHYIPLLSNSQILKSAHRKLPFEWSAFQWNSDYKSSFAVLLQKSYSVNSAQILVKHMWWNLISKKLQIVGLQLRYKRSLLLGFSLEICKRFPKNIFSVHHYVTLAVALRVCIYNEKF